MRLADSGFIRKRGETWEEFADRLEDTVPALSGMVRNLEAVVWGKQDVSVQHQREHLHNLLGQLRLMLPLWRYVGGLLNPIGWLISR